MKQLFLFQLTILLTLASSAQIFKKDDLVEVDPSLSESAAVTWKQATVSDFDSTGNKYMVKLPEK